MSRAPANETPSIPLNAALSPFGVIDFTDSQHMQASPGVVGGPPAYLDAHGIRYVPAGSLDSAADNADGPSGLVPMSRDVAKESTPVSAHELNSRVDERIRRFMKSPGYRNSDGMSSDASSASARLRALRKQMDSRSGPDFGARRDHYRDDDMDPRGFGRDSRDFDAEPRSFRRDSFDDAEPRGARSFSRRGPEDSMESRGFSRRPPEEPLDASAQAEEKLRALRQECEAAAAASSRKLAAAAGARARKPGLDY